MIGFIKTLVYVAVIFLIAGVFLMWQYRIPTTSYILSQVLNNPVTIGDVDISLTLSRLSGQNVAIVNPQASQDVMRNAVKTKSLEFRTNFFNLFRKELVIDEIHLDRVQFFVDMYNVTGSKSNWKTIIGNIHDRAERRFPDGKKHKRPVIIKKIIIQDVVFSYRNPILTSGVTTLDPINYIEVTDVGSGHPVSTAQIVGIITTAMLKRFATVSGYKQLIESLPQIPANWIKNILINPGNAEDASTTMSLESYFNESITPSFPSMPAPKQFFKKMFTFSKKPEDGDE